MKTARRQQGSLKRVARAGGTEVWVFRWREIGTDGLQHPRKLVVGTTSELRSEAAARQQVAKMNLNINLDRSATAGQPATVGGLIEHFRVTELPEADDPDGEGRAFSTKDNVRSYLRRWIEPRWGSYDLNHVKAPEVEAWLKGLRLAPTTKHPEGKRASRGTKKKIRDVMHMLFEHAIRYDWMDKNPITSVRQSGKRESVPDILGVEELVTLLNSLALRERTAVFLDFGVGARRGELQGLKWSDFSFENRELRIQRSNVKQHEGKVKTETSAKPVPLSDSLIQDLLLWRSQTPYAKDTDYVFASSAKKGKQPLWMSVMMRDRIQPAAKKCGITKHVSWHTMRRTYATLVQANNKDPKVTQELLRHASAKLSMDVYAQAMSEKKRKAQTKVVEMVSASQRKAAKAAAGGR